MIVDASVGLKWVSREADSESAGLLLGYSNLEAPALFMHEVAYVIAKRVRQRLFTLDMAREAWSQLRRADLRLFDDTPYQQPAFELSLRLGANFYDCVYLALAISEEVPLVTADERFVRAVRSAPELAGHIQTLAEAAA